MTMAMAASKALLLFARAARSIGAATYRVASLAERRALSPASPEAAMAAAAAASGAPRSSGGRSAAAAAVHSHRTAAPPIAMEAPIPRTSAPSSEDLSKPGDRVEFVPKEEDLESDEALWNLYERWCKVFNQKRGPDEMARLFSKFKKRVLHVHSINNANANQSSKLGLSKFSDGKLAEMCANRDPYESLLAKKFPNTSLFFGANRKLLKQVFADFGVVNGKLFVYYPYVETEEGGSRRKEELSVDYEVVSGKLFADLPVGHELVVLNNEWIQRHW